MDKPTVYINNNGAVSGTKIEKKIFLEAYLQQQEFTLTFVGVACFAACLSSIAQVTFIFHSFS